MFQNIRNTAELGYLRYVRLMLLMLLMLLWLLLALWRAAAGLAAVKELCLYRCSVTYTLFLIRNSGVLDSGGGVLAKASLLKFSQIKSNPSASEVDLKRP
jgi:hypothetical protein